MAALRFDRQSACIAVDGDRERLGQILVLDLEDLEQTVAAGTVGGLAMVRTLVGRRSE